MTLRESLMALFNFRREAAAPAAAANAAAEMEAFLKGFSIE